MIDLITPGQVKALIADDSGKHISILMPAVRAGAEIQQNPTRFKNLVRAAEKYLKESGMTTKQVEAFLEPAWEQVNNEVFWKRQSDGLATFISDETFVSYRLPLNFEEQVILGEEFHIKPLLPIFSKNGRFYVLSLSQNQVRLLEGTRYSIDEIDLRDAPKSLAEALMWDDPEEELQGNPEAGAPVGGREPNILFYGTGADEANKINKENIKRFFQKLDKGLHEVLQGDNAPLILAGVQYLHPIFQEASHYPYLLKEGIYGNPEQWKDAVLHEKAWEVLEPHLQEEQQKAAELFRQQAGMESGRASNDISEIIPAAFNGRVGQLFIQDGVEQWGSYDWETTEAVLQDEPSPENRDLYDLAAVQTFLNDGVIYLVEPHELPDEDPIAAVFRY
jgi:hypothetical protein